MVNVNDRNTPDDNAYQAGRKDAGWQPVRILKALDTSRSLGWPPENRDVRAMVAWCQKFCQGRWTIDLNENTVATFRFERRRDAMEFAVRWFPNKCV
jgi:hypothetical protein